MAEVRGGIWGSEYLLCFHDSDLILRGKLLAVDISPMLQRVTTGGDFN